MAVVGRAIPYTVEPPTLGSCLLSIPCREIVLILEVDLHSKGPNRCILVVLCTGVVLISEGLLLEVLL